MKGKFPSITICVVLSATMFASVDIGFEVVDRIKGTTIYVPTDYSTIQEAIDAANDGDTVFVNSKGGHFGSYRENLIISKSIELIGEDRETTRIEGDAYRWYGNPIIRIFADDVTISDFSLFLGGDGIVTEGCNTNISDNKFFWNLFSGITLWSSNNIVTDNIITGGINGILIGGSRGNQITNNIMEGSGISLWGSHLEDWTTNNIDTSNTANGKPIYYWKNRNGGTIPGGAGQVILANCTNVRVENQDLSDATIGVKLGFSSNNYILNNDVSTNWYDICAINSNKNYINDNTASNGIYGIRLSNSHGNNIAGNIISDNYVEGIYYTNSHENIIMDNYISNNGHLPWPEDFGEEPWLEGSWGREDAGITLEGSSNNWIYYNELVDNIIQAQDNRHDNLWDNGYPFGGNYWSDYYGVDNFKGPNQDIPGSDGIGDTPYVIDSNSRDKYPLMGPYSPSPPDLRLFDWGIDITPPSPIIDGMTITVNATVYSFSISASNIDVKFYNGDPDTNNDQIPDPTALEIGSEVIDITKDSLSVASIQWIPPTIGTYEIYIWVDPYNNIQEENDTNNLNYKGFVIIPRDLFLSNSDIQFTPPSPVINDTTITINATIFCSGRSISNVEVKFYNCDPDTEDDMIPDGVAEEIGNVTIDIMKDSSAFAIIQWIPPTVEIYQIFVWVDPMNTTIELNERNNLATKTLSVFNWIDSFYNFTKTESKQCVEINDGDVVLDLPTKFDFDASDEGFSLESDQIHSHIYWDSNSGRIYFRANNHDPKDEMFIKPLSRTINENSSSWTLSARFRITVQGKWQYAMPLFIANSNVESIRCDPSSIYFGYDSNSNTIRARYRDSNGNTRIYISRSGNVNIEYLVRVLYDNITKNLKLQIRNQNDVLLKEGSYVIGTNPFDGFTFGKIGVGTDAYCGHPDPVCRGWTDDIIYFQINNKSGKLISKPITLPSDKVWSKLYINKTEPSNAYINVTIIDAASGEPIPNFKDLTGDIIDLTTLDPIIFPSIKLVGNFTESAMASPKLHFWSINWKAVPFSIPLKKGWNLLSIPQILTDNHLQTVLQSIDGFYDSVQWYDATDLNDPWKHYHTSKPPDMNDLNEINHKMGFWINIIEPNGTIFNGCALPTNNQFISLYEGWNLVGYPSTSNRLRDSALNNLEFGIDIDFIWTFDASTQKWNEITESDYFKLGKGYWIHAKYDCEWLVFSSILNLNMNRYYSSIQEAIDHANSHDTIKIPPGTYNEELTIIKPITLIGENNKTTIIKGNLNPTIEISSHNVTISNLNLPNGPYGVYVTDSKDITITNNVISDHRIGIYAYNSSIIISNNTISNNPKGTGGAGIRLIDCKDSIIEYNSIRDIVYSVYLMDSHTIIKNNLISPTDGYDDRLDSIGIALYHGSNATVINNTIKGGDVGIGIEYYSFPLIEGNAISCSEYYGVLIKNFGSPILNNNVIEYCKVYGIFSNHGTEVYITNNTMMNNDILLCNSTINNLWLINGNATTINSTMVGYTIDGGILIVQWYLHVRV
ncbi:MAG: right-handed parallel beta-helix repeat-containing protein, partial [Methanomassiliicoccales archaeon]